MGPGDTCTLTITDISEEMKITKSKVRNWIKRGLPATFHTTSRDYHIKHEDLLKFLEANPKDDNACNISKYLFSPEPEWLKAKRVSDRNNYPTNYRKSYTNDEDKIIVRLHKRGYSVSEIAQEMHRTNVAIIERLRVLCCSRVYSEEEKNILREHAATKTITELQELLPNRTVESIKTKCRHLGLKWLRG